MIEVNPAGLEQCSDLGVIGVAAIDLVLARVVAKGLAGDDELRVRDDLERVRAGLRGSIVKERVVWHLSMWCVRLCGTKIWNKEKDAEQKWRSEKRSGLQLD